MEDNDAAQTAQKHLNTERTPRTTTLVDMGEKKCWQVTFAGDGEDPVIVTLDDQTSEVLQVFEPLKMAPPGLRDIITGDPDKLRLDGKGGPS